MATHGRKNADSNLVIAFASGATVGEAAHRAGVSARTAQRRLQDDTFRSQVDHIREQAMERAVGQLASASVDAVKTLTSLMSGRTPPTVRLGAARAVLELCLRTNEAISTARRLDALERLMATADGRTA